MQEKAKRTGYEFLTDLIPKGRKNAITGATLDRLLCLEKRTRYKLIENARKSGLIICACDDGYFLPSNAEEMKSYYETAHAKAITVLSTLTALRKTLKTQGIQVK